MSSFDNYTITPIARISSPFKEKFGIPRQSNIISGITATIIFEPHYRNADALRGLDGFDYLWLIWLFSKNLRSQWSPTVRPPRLGGNQRMGVFATRSSFRPNALALSSVRILSIRPETPDGPIIEVAGADLMDGTPIFDIKPYLPYTDAHPGARSGFAESSADKLLEVVALPELLEHIPEHLRQPLLDILAHDPRPSFHSDHSRSYGMLFLDYNVRFNVPSEDTLQLLEISKL